MQYHLVSLIGVGSFAEVWHAWRLDRDGKICAPDVAVKIGLYSRDTETTRLEYDVLCRIAPVEHDGLIRILDITWRDDVLAFAMELADGNLISTIGANAPADSLMPYIEGVARSLDHLHGLRVVHGGINPYDILVRGGRAKIADFGPLLRQFSRRRTPIHKALCMAPEVGAGSLLPQSDQYALAAAYSWMRLGNRAWSTSLGRNDLLPKIDINLLPLSERRVISSALSPDITRRFASCCSFVEALKEVVLLSS